MAGPRPGTDAAGYFVREGSPDRVGAEFAPVVAAAVEAVQAAFGPDRLHSAYLYGSIPRGAAEAGRSDLDLLLALRQPPGPADRAAVDALSAALDEQFTQITGVGALLLPVERLLSEAERYDLGWFLACLCIPLLGPDLAKQLPRYRPEDTALARETNGEIADWLPRWRERAAAGADPVALTRGAARKLVRTGLTLVMGRWGGWTSDLAHSAEVFAAYYPEQAPRMRRAAAAARVGSADPAVPALLLDELGPWLAAEYARVHGVKGESRNQSRS
ncbi:nucleotidyltransferase [Streptomyces tateyamensis]|uniref:Nucleotidyltransferase n=1 Tax=Streptomyces tateyamensis TaxID=565073 RepID=A0A2V4P6D8_9ACTN|nr:nucleotidyltransferase domain-containing protein [Streptomyces tateyamensis]PYC78586.1 nucleotidyltransferase [Streptomyces tateyamensis]